MKSNYKKLGKYINEIDIRNMSGSEDSLLGISTQKRFINSIANTIGTDFKKYKVVKKNQFAYVPDTSRRGDKIGIALLLDRDKAIISQAYTVFEIIDENKLLPEYLMMWFRREEFDRYARYMSHGSVREIFSWEEMCDVELPVPSIEKQKKIIKEYNTILDRIKLNEDTIKNLEAVSESIYSEWFINFNFEKEKKLNINKSDKGENLRKELPIEWSLKKADEIFDISIGKTPSRADEKCFTDNKNDIKWSSIADIKNKVYVLDTKEKITIDAIKKYNMKIIPKGTVIVSFKLTVGRVAITTEEMCTNEAIAHFKTSNNNLKTYIYHALKNYDYNLLGSSSSIGNAVNSKIIKNMKLIIPTEDIIDKFSKKINPIMNKILISEKKILILENLKEIILLRISKMGE